MAQVPVAMSLLAMISLGAAVDRGGRLLPVYLLASVVAATGTVRGWLLRVEVHPEKLTLVNWLRTIDLTWGEVARIGRDEDGLWVRLREGGEVRASAFQHGHRARGFAREPARIAAERLDGIRKRRGRGR